jgi:HAMP domain-containing protein
MSSRPLKLGIRAKMVFVIIPLLVFGFAVSGYITVLSTRNSLLSQSSSFIRYKLRQFESYASRQWANLENSGLSEEEGYVDIVHNSLKEYAGGMITRKSELIFVLDDSGTLVFSTGNPDFSASFSRRIRREGYLENAELYRYSIDGGFYYGLSLSLGSPEWEVVIVEEARSFTDEIRSIGLMQSLTFFIILVVIVASVTALLTTVTAPIQRFRNTIREIMEDKDFSRKVRIEYPDEIGDLAYDFNILTANFDLAYTKMKDYALNEVIARKELNIREYETLDVLARASDYKDPETAAHINRVSDYALLMAKLLGLDEETRELIYYATPLHDIGKLGIPDAILLKPARLDDRERKVMNTHTSIGYEIMENPSSKYLKAGALIAISHHEC